MVDAHGDDAWEAVGDSFVDGHYGSLRGRVRTHVIDQHLRTHLEPPPLQVVDVGGGAGDQSIPLAREGYQVTIVDSSPSMLERAERRLASEDAAVGRRVRLVEASGEDAPYELGGQVFGGVVCDGEFMCQLVDFFHEGRQLRCPAAT